MKSLKILMLNSSSIYGGGEYYVLKLASILKNRGYKVSAGCKKNRILHRKLEDAGINSIIISFPESASGRLWKNVRHVKQIIKYNGINIVHSNTGYDRTTAGFAIAGTPAKHITSCHSLESLSHNFTHFIRNKFLTHHFIADGSSIKAKMISENKIPNEKISVVHNGIDPDEMKRDMNLRERTRAEFGVSRDDVLIGSLGRLVNFKGYRYLINAFKNVTQKLQNVKLVIVGDGELMHSLKDEAAMLRIEDKIIFAGFRDDLQAVYSAFDIYVNSSISGGGELFPFSILYAMAQGIPVVASSVGDIPQMVVNEQTGYLVEERSPFLIYEKLIELSMNPAVREKMGTEGLKRLKENFSLDEMAAKVEEIYTQIS